MSKSTMYAKILLPVFQGINAKKLKQRFEWSDIHWINIKDISEQLGYFKRND